MEQVEEFVENHMTKKGEKLKESTKGEYRNAFSMFKDKFGTEDFKALFTNEYHNVFDKLKEEYSSDYYIHKVNGFCLYYSIPYTVPTTFKEKTKKTVPNMDSIRDAIIKIKDKKAKLFLTINTDTSGEMLRRDWANTMIKEYTSEEEHSAALSLYSIESGVFTTEEDNKTYRPREFKLSEYAHSLIKEYVETLENKKFLFDTKSVGKKNRCGVYGKYISGITKKYLGENVNMNAFRSGVSTREGT
jgi:DNA-directed RNA polymerase beta' subunit